MLGVTRKDDHKWSDKKMQEKEGFEFNTVEGLRARLLAERHASKLATQEADSIANKLIELEKKLREETKLREKAERRLQFLKKKLESFNISNYEHSCTTPTSSSSSREETERRTTNPLMSHSSMQEVSVQNSKDLKSDQSKSRFPMSSSKSSTKDSITLNPNVGSNNDANNDESSVKDSKSSMRKNGNE